jgi:hypothetical protein
VSELIGEVLQSRFTCRAVGICASTNLVLTDPEATPKDIFLMGYSQADLSFTDVRTMLFVVIAFRMALFRC